MEQDHEYWWDHLDEYMNLIDSAAKVGDLEFLRWLNKQLTEEIN